ncbi:VWA containing CoxE family protein [Thermincola ferriacetica]|uniref:VWA containing CoxE family protein n=1 Tax=Thermincola ferriacetica TaxID=281456 RepID=A0A0L6W6Q5_9FIRM|nr:VWA domain-containing protein [Thermincola ferriacetica]KNZ71200.1 VWA containing CoxE family protein [Thermincola ferriacetica]
MEEQILYFCRLLRKAGIKVSVSEVNDCLKGLRLTGLSKPVFYQTLKSTLVKDHAFSRTFDKLFAIFFERLLMLPENEAGAHRGYGEIARQRRELMATENFAENFFTHAGTGQGAGDSGSYKDVFVHLIRLGDHSLYRAYIDKGLKSLCDLQQESIIDIDELVRKVKVYLEWNMGINQLEKEAEKAGGDLWWVWQARLTELEEELRQALEEKLIARFGEKALTVVLERENLNTLDFFLLSENQVEEMHKKISRLGHQLASRAKFRKKAAKKGTVALQRTIRKSMSTGGVPIKPAYRDTVPARPEFWVLCDVSGSVKRFSEFMLQLMYSIQSRFLHVRSFVFVDTIAEATACFQNREINEAIKEMYNSLKFSKTGFSDYGEVFRELYENYSEQLNRKVTLLIIGDSRNNYRPHQSEYLQKLKDRVKTIIWLNPERAEVWDSEDSIMKTYAPFCKRVLECRNLEQLSRIARKIL